MGNEVETQIIIKSCLFAPFFDKNNSGNFNVAVWEARRLRKSLSQDF